MIFKEITLPGGVCADHVLQKHAAGFLSDQTMTCTKVAAGVRPAGRPGEEGAAATGSAERVLRVAAYCRVSTLYDTQKESASVQTAHYRDLIRAHSGWQNAGIYCDNGISAKQMEGRDELRRLLEACRKGKVDLILTKSISRFARNTTDCLHMIRMLRTYGVHVYFEKENLHTGSMEGELMLTILASMAEDESKSISANEKWAVQKRFQQGTFKLSNPPYGYRIEDGRLVIDKREAEVVRRIFAAVLEGKGANLITEELNLQGIPTKKGKGRWHPGTLRNILQNEIYIGDLRMQKTYTDEQLQRRKNTGARTQYYMDCHHEAIIDRQTFDAARMAIRQRGYEKGRYREENAREQRISTEPSKETSGGANVLTSVLRCGCCGAPMVRARDYLKHETIYYRSCRTHIRNKEKCGRKRIREERIYAAVQRMIRKLIFAQTVIFDLYLERIRKELACMEGNIPGDGGKAGEWEKKRDELMQMYACAMITPHEYRRRLLWIEAQIECCREQSVRIRNDADLIAEILSVRQWLRSRDAEAGTGLSRESAEEFIERFVKRMVIKEDGTLRVELRCGLCFDEYM